MNEEEMNDYLKFKINWEAWESYERFKKSIQDLESEKYERAIKQYRKEHNL